CMVYEEAARSAVNQAVGQAVEAEMGSWLAGYTDVMLYQMVYTQSFYLGGFGISPEDFDEGQGATWQIITEDQDEASSFTAERALLKHNEDGSSWWYLNFVPEDSEPMEFEVLMDQNLQAREMYLRDMETGEIRHHMFEQDQAQIEQTASSEDSLANAGYSTNYFFLNDWEQYHEGTENISVGAGSYNTDVLLYTAAEEQQVEHDFEYRWWVSENVPGHLLKFEYKEVDEEGTFHGEMIELRQDYQPRFATF
ncbi:MAG: hypothetical protein WD491_01030, partial [Balneolales bacterium]